MKIINFELTKLPKPLLRNQYLPTASFPASWDFRPASGRPVFQCEAPVAAFFFKSPLGRGDKANARDLFRKRALLTDGQRTTERCPLCCRGRRLFPGHPVTFASCGKEGYVFPAPYFIHRKERIARNFSIALLSTTLREPDSSTLTFS